MEIGPESILNSAGDPARHCPERRRGHTASTTDSATVFGPKPVHKMFYLYLGLAIFLYLPTSIYCAPAYHEQSQNSVDTIEGRFQNKYEQYYRDDANDIGEKDTIKQTSLKEKLREKLSTSKHDRIKAKLFTLKAEINLEWRDMKDFLRGLVKGSAMTTHRTDDTPSHRSTRDMESQMGAAASGDGPWVSNLSPAAVVGTIVGGTVGVFLIVVLTVIFCSYRNYSSLEMRQRTADVYGGSGHHQADRRM